MGSDKMQTYILYKLKTLQHSFNIVSIYVLKTGSAGEPVRLLVHGSTSPTGSITGRTVLHYKYKIKFALTKYIKSSE